MDSGVTSQKSRILDYTSVKTSKLAYILISLIHPDDVDFRSPKQ